MTGAADRIVLALNSGSSSFKAGLYRVGPTGLETLQATAAPVRDAAELEVALDAALDAMTRSHLPPPDIIGHRIVHGGPNLLRHGLIDAGVMAELTAARGFAPLHGPAAVSVIERASRRFPGVPQAACFDTAFHSGMPALARTLPVGRDAGAEGVVRYGFHGLSCESIVRQLGAAAPSRLLIAHLGAGASVTAVLNGRSIDTSMGLTPSGGVMMSTRAGDLDPGVLIFLMRERDFDAARLEDLLDHRSGLLGVSGLSGDMERLRAATANPDVRLALAMFAASVRKQLAAMITVLDGVDLVVFTGGIGENDQCARAEICDGLGWIGVALDAEANASGRDAIHAAGSRCAVRVLPSREDEEIARHAWVLCP